MLCGVLGDKLLSILRHRQKSTMGIAQLARATAPDTKVDWHGRVALIAKPGGPNTGVGRYVEMLHRGLLDAGVDAVRVSPRVPPLPNAVYGALRALRVDVRTFLTNYPVWANHPEADVYHFTSQNLATLLLFHRPRGKVAVTVHDIIPYMLRNDPKLCSYRTVADRWFDRLAMEGLKRADVLIAVSQYTKRCVVEQLGIAAERIHVVYQGVNQETFRPLPVPTTVRERYGLPEGRHYLIYVGSEDPRKNLDTLLRAIAEIRLERPDVELIKVGRPHFRAERQRLIDLASRLGVREAIHFLDEVPEGDLPILYNIADVCVMASLYEGFGFPVLESMACGTPVVCAKAASLPELVTDTSSMVVPPDEKSIATAVLTALRATNSLGTRTRTLPSPLVGFSWRQTADNTKRLYETTVGVIV